jgi:hypothetical protein
MILTMNPSIAQCDASGVDCVRRKDGLFTVHLKDGTTISARLERPNIADVMSVIADVRAAQAPAPIAQLALF